MECEKCIVIPYDSIMGYYEISHYPGGIIIRSDRDDRERYKIMLTQRNMVDEPEVRTIIEETGLPVISN